MNDFIRSLIRIGEESGSLPVWHLAGNETNIRPGSHSIPVLLDAYLKGYDNFDAQNLYSLIKNNELTEINIDKFKLSDLKMLDQMDQIVSKSFFRKKWLCPLRYFKSLRLKNTRIFL